jgi:hypothetical protein
MQLIDTLIQLSYNSSHMNIKNDSQRMQRLPTITKAIVTFSNLALQHNKQWMLEQLNCNILNFDRGSLHTLE